MQTTKLESELNGTNQGCPRLDVPPHNFCRLRVASSFNAVPFPLRVIVAIVKEWYNPIWESLS